MNNAEAAKDPASIRSSPWGAAAGLIVVSMLFSEYALASGLAGAVLIGGRGWMVRERRRNVWIAVGTIVLAILIGYALFRATADMSLRSDASVSNILAATAAHPLDLLVFVSNSAWHCLLGGLLAAAADVRFGVNENSTLAAIAFGILIAGMVAVAVRSREANGSDPVRIEWRKWILLSAAFLIALIPEITRQGLFNIHPWQVERYSTRFCVAAAPIAAIMTVRLFQIAFRRAYIGAAVLAFIAAHAAFLDDYTQYRQAALVRRIGQVLLPYASANPDLTLAVTPEYYGRAYEITQRATADWPVSVSSRTWLMWEEQIPLYLHRGAERSGACESMRTMNMDAMGMRRVGRIGQILLIAPQRDGEFNVENYCVPSDAPPDGARLPVRTSQSPPLAPPE
jgi:hypothetical protein